MKKFLVAGAGSGIGSSIFNLLSHNNHHVYGISRRGIKTTSLEPGNNYHCDLKNETDIAAFAAKFRQATDRLDGLYLTAGDGLFKNLSDITSAEWDNHFSLNVKSSFLLLKELYPLLKNARRPFVCFFSSTAGKQGFADSSAYCASKHAVAGLAKAVREEWREDNIRVFIIYLGAVSTEIWDERPEFDRKDMIHPDELAEFLSMLAEMPDSISLDEISLMPIKGIL